MKYATYINGSVVAPHEVDAWERKRILIVAKKLGAKIDADNPDVDSLSKQLAAYKLSLGYEKIIRRLGAGLSASSASAQLMTYASFGRRKISVTEMVVEGMSSDEVVKGIDALMFEASEEHDAVNIGACPDHYALRQLDNGRLEVVETTGGSPFPIQFFIEYGSEVGLTVPRDAAFPHQSAGIARLGNGKIIGGVRHQFRDEENGFRVRLAVEFPWLTPGYFIRHHQLHLACEFTHWFRWLIDRKQHANRVDGQPFAAGATTLTAGGNKVRA